MDSRLISRRDLNFLLYEWLDAEALTANPRYAAHSRASFDAVLDTCARLAEEQFAPHNKKNDQCEPHYDGDIVRIIPEVKCALDAFFQAGLMAATQERALGGVQLPELIEKAAFVWLAAANPGTLAYPLRTMTCINTLLKCATAEQIDTYVKPMLDGRFFATMCLSEPDAGSCLSELHARALPQDDGSFRLSGSKMWVCAGEHELSENIVHLVLARAADRSGQTVAGAGGLSLFIVPKFLVNLDGSQGERNDVALAGLNRQMGCRGATNCLLKFGDGKFKPQGRAGAIAYLAGPLHGGLALVLAMLGSARIDAGLGAAALGYTGYLHALDYAQQRIQGHAAPGGADTQQPIIAHADVKRMLLAQKAYVEGALALNLYCARLMDEERCATDAGAGRQAARLLAVLTPIAKAWSAQWCLAANDLALQVHGACGYTREYNVEQIYRDNRQNAIDEGTHGILALDLLARKVTLEHGSALEALGEAIHKTIVQAATHDELAGYAKALAHTLQKIAAVTRQLQSLADQRLALANASMYLDVFGHAVIAWIWLGQAIHCLNRHDDAAFYAGKLQACQYFFVYELPKLQAQLDVLASLDTTTLAMQPEWF